MIKEPTAKDTPVHPQSPTIAVTFVRLGADTIKNNDQLGNWYANMALGKIKTHVGLPKRTQLMNSITLTTTNEKRTGA